MQFQSDILGINIDRPECIETTALGAAYLAGLAVGVYASTDELKENKRVERTFIPESDSKWREESLSRWREAVNRTLGWQK